MKSPLLLAPIFSLALANATAQTAQDSVKNAVNLLFEGMKTANADMVRASFTDSAVLQSIVVTPDGKTEVRNEAIKDFADFVRNIKPGDADERITFDVIRIDGPLATVWTPYNFYYKGKFSHCGVDSYQLVRMNGKWKIQYLIDTRRKEGCQ